MGAQTMLLTLNLDRIAWQPCNPAVGGPAKSQLVHEIDALGGIIGKMADKCYVQKKTLNLSKVGHPLVSVSGCTVYSTAHTDVWCRALQFGH